MPSNNSKYSEEMREQTARHWSTPNHVHRNRVRKTLLLRDNLLPSFVLLSGSEEGLGSRRFISQRAVGTQGIVGVHPLSGEHSGLLQSIK